MTKWTKEYIKEYQKKYQEKFKKKPEKKTCPICEKVFMANATRKVCSQECSKKNKKSQKKASKKRYEKKAKEKDPTFAIGDHIIESARNRNIEAPHKATEYRDWYREKTKLCCYCGNTNDIIVKYLYKIGEKVTVQQNRLQIERIDSSKGYIFNNMTLACSICNTHKSDIISHDDFKEIAQKYIAPKINQKLDG